MGNAHGSSPRSQSGAGCGALKGTAMSKKRGGQSGNTNAYKQGYFSRQIPADIQWEPADSFTDSVAGEINATRALMSRLASALQIPDPDLKDPHAPDKMLILATRRLAVMENIQSELQDPLPLSAQVAREITSHFQHSSDLYTVQNLEKASQRMFAGEFPPLKAWAPPDLLEKYEYILSIQQDLDESDEDLGESNEI